MNTEKIYKDGRNEENIFFHFRPFFSSLIVTLSCLFIIFGFSFDAFAQVKKPEQKTTAPKTQPAVTLPKVTQIDAPGLKNLLKPNGKPLLINFWATWCDPCREEFPDLVKIATDYKDKIDLITVSLDDLAELNNDVPKFLAEMKSESPAYLLKTPDEGAAIALVSKDWQGGLPFTILFNANGETAYSKMGKFKTDVLRAEIETVLEKKSDKDTQVKINVLREIENLENPYEKGKDNAQKDILAKKLQFISYGEQSSENSKLKVRLKAKYDIETLEFGCKTTEKLLEYIKGYNEILATEINNRFGENVLETAN